MFATGVKRATSGALSNTLSQCWGNDTDAVQTLNKRYVDISSNVCMCTIMITNMQSRFEPTDETNKPQQQHSYGAAGMVSFDFYKL